MNSAEILEVLRGWGGEIRDDDGRATRMLMNLMGRKGPTKSLNAVLWRMERDGLIERWVVGGCVYYIRLAGGTKVNDTNDIQIEEASLKVGDRVSLAGDDSVTGVIVRVDDNGFMVVVWDPWYGHLDQLVPG